ncbi:MAG TPA: S9 family peptidase [Candidatus Acidoferrales bacterium]|nr:S9 family peptidase [Candidatus Acidoferrales bacterium]
MVAKIISNVFRAAIRCAMSYAISAAALLIITLPASARRAPVAQAKKSTTATHNSRQAASAAMQQALRAMFNVHAISEAVISPDGRRVAWVESLSGKNGAPSPNSAIHVAEWKSHSAPLRITAATGGAAAAESNVAWSADSKQLAFFSDAAHSGQSQVYVAAPGEAARQLTHVKGDLSNPMWSPDGKSIAFLFIENAPRAAGPLAAEAPDEGVVGEKIYEQRLAIVDLATGRVRQITPADMYVYEYDWSPDGKKLVATAAHGNGDDNWYVAQIYIFDAANLAGPQSIYKSDMQIGTPKWSPDGETIGFIAGLMSDEGSVGGDIYTLPADSSSEGGARDVTPDIKASPSSLEWSADSRAILFAEIVDGQSGVASVNLDSGEVSSLYVGAERLGSNGFGVGISLSRDGKTAATVRQSFSQPPEVWAGPIGNWKQITHVNSALHPAWGKAETLHWQSDMGAGQKIQGWVVYPLDYDSSKKYPLVVEVHGGPASANMPSWPSRRSYAAALPAAGYFLLLPNPRGSYGSGEAFTRANVKDFGGGDFRDIMAGVDAAIASLPVDPHRLGITGWSYGGYMSMWAVTQTHRFNAAVIGAGLADWLSYYGENQIDKWMTFYFGDTVYNDPAVYAKSAPITFIKNVQTPSLIVVGDSDGECPPPQSYEFWHALVTLGIPTQFVIYPHEGHGFANPAHSRDVVERAVAWFDAHL